MPADVERLADTVSLLRVQMLALAGDEDARARLEALLERGTGHGN